MMRAKAVYRALLHCYPAAFRHEYGGQMSHMFADQLNDARRAGGRLPQAALWARAAWDALTVAPGEHWNVMRQDLRYALRTMAARPSFAVITVLSLALGIGANTAIFSLWNGVLFAPLPVVDQPEQLVILSNPDEVGLRTGRWEGRTDGPRAWLTFEEFDELRDRADGFSGLMASQSSLNTWQIRIERSELEEARGRLVSDEYFQVLGVGAAIGRVFTTTARCADARCTVISHDYWQRRFAGNPDVLGRIITIRQAALSIIGVAPAGFIGETGGQRPDLWLPLGAQPAVLPGIDRLHDTPPNKVMWLHVFGRLKPGTTVAQAEGQANAVFQAGLESFYGKAALGERGREFLDQRLRVRSAARGATGRANQFSDSLTALLAGVGVLLLIACANLANLLLARGAVRKPEIALRLSLGASRERIVRQLVTESLVLAAMGGVAAVAVAYILHGSLLRMLSETDPDFQMSFSMNPVVSAFVLMATLVAALLFGVLPAVQVTRGGTGDSLRADARGAIGTMGQMRSGKVLVSLQLALSLSLLIGAGLLERTFYNLQRADLGFPAARLQLVRVDARDSGYEEARRDALFRDLREQLQLIPGVTAVSFSQLGIYVIARRTAEIAVRIALGAQPGRVVSMILRETIAIVIAGLALGGGLAYAASRLIASRLYGVGPEDPLTLTLSIGVLLLVALAAAFLPAHRASKLDPIAALRQA